MAWRICLMSALLTAGQGQALAQPSAQQPQLPPPMPAVAGPLHSDWRHDALGSYEIGADFMMFGNMLAPPSPTAGNDPGAETPDFLVGARAAVARPLLSYFVRLATEQRNRTTPRAIALLIDGAASLGVGAGAEGERAMFLSGGPRLGSNMYWRRLAYEVRMGPELVMQSGDQGTVAALGFSISMAFALPSREGWQRQHKFVISETITPTTAGGTGEGDVTIWLGLGYRLQLK